MDFQITYGQMTDLDDILAHRQPRAGFGVVLPGGRNDVVKGRSEIKISTHPESTLEYVSWPKMMEGTKILSSYDVIIWNA